MINSGDKNIHPSPPEEPSFFRPPTSGQVREDECDNDDGAAAYTNVPLFNSKHVAADHILHTN